MVNELPDVPANQKVNEISKLWKGLSENEREKYKQEVANANKQYKIDYAKSFKFIADKNGDLRNKDQENCRTNSEICKRATDRFTINNDVAAKSPVANENIDVVNDDEDSDEENCQSKSDTSTSESDSGNTKDEMSRSEDSGH
ncbi:hypothetical protein CHUAL_010499 [Chamberlinius hualienensis]